MLLFSDFKECAYGIMVGEVNSVFVILRSERLGFIAFHIGEYVVDLAAFAAS